MPDARTLYESLWKTVRLSFYFKLHTSSSYFTPVLQVALVVSRWAALVIFCSVWSGPCSLGVPMFAAMVCTQELELWICLWAIWCHLRPLQSPLAHGPIGYWCTAFGLIWLDSWMTCHKTGVAGGSIHRESSAQGGQISLPASKFKLDQLPVWCFLFSAFKTLMGFSFSTIFQLHEQTNMPFNMHQWISISRCLWRMDFCNRTEPGFHGFTLKWCLLWHVTVPP